jgi:hypothetical protein
MIVRILDVFKNQMTVMNNVKFVKPCITYFRVVFEDETSKDFSFKNFDFFVECYN